MRIRSAYRIGEEGNSTIVGLIGWELPIKTLAVSKSQFDAWCYLLKPRLSKVPQCSGSIFGVVGCRLGLIATKGANQKGVILLGNRDFIEVLEENGTVFPVMCPISQLVVGETDIGWLVYIKDVDFIIPRPWVKCCRVRVQIHSTWAVLLE